MLAAKPSFPAEMRACVISNVEGAEGLARATEAGVATKIISHKVFASREEFDAAIDASLRAADVSLVCEAGFMRIHSEWFANLWAGKLLNIHPSLLPSFPGIRVHRQALDAGVKISGCTVHFYRAGSMPARSSRRPRCRCLSATHRHPCRAHSCRRAPGFIPRLWALLPKAELRSKSGQAVFPR